MEMAAFLASWAATVVVLTVAQAAALVVGAMAEVAARF